MNKILTILFNPIIYIVAILVILCFSKDSLSYVNIFNIFKNYFNNFIKKHHLTRMFIIFPMLFSQSINLVKLVNIDIINVMTVSVSILTTIFFAYIAFFDGYKVIKTGDASSTVILKEISEESINITNYEILICIIILVFSMFYPIIDKNDFKRNISDLGFISIKSVYSFILYYLFIHLILNLLILLKRYDVLKRTTQGGDHHGQNK